MTKALAQTYNAAYEHRLNITYAVLAACAVVTCIYAMNVYRVVSRTVALQQAETRITAVTASVDNLDAQYLELSSSVTPDSLKQYGLSEGQVSAYISRSASLGSVALGGHEL